MKNFVSKMLESGVALAVSMAVLYYLTYLRLKGALLVYSLPTEFIHITTPNIIETLNDLVMEFWVIILFPVLALLLIQKIKDHRLTALLKLTIFLASVIGFSYVLEYAFNLLNIIIIIIGVYIWCATFIRVLINGKHERGLRAKWNADEKVQSQRGKSDDSVSALTRVFVIIAVIIVISSSVLQHFAKYNLYRSWYFVAQDHNNRVVVFQNDNQYVLMERDGNSLLPKYEVVSKDKIGKLSYENLGELETQTSDLYLDR